MSDWKMDVIRLLLEVLERYESGNPEDGENYAQTDEEADNLAFLKHKVFGDPYPPKK